MDVTAFVGERGWKMVYFDLDINGPDSYDLWTLDDDEENPLAPIPSDFDLPNPITLPRTIIEAQNATFRRWDWWQQQRHLLESPLEELFWETWRDNAFENLTKMLVQLSFEVQEGLTYRLDFALPDKMIAFETDGFTYHNTRKQFNRDRRRDLSLSLKGWRIHRFSGDFLRNYPLRTLQIANELAK